MPRPRVLLLDSAFSALPIHAALASLDIDLWVMGGRPDDVLAREAGARWVEQDYSQVEAVRRWVSAHDCHLVVPGCTDVSLNTAAALGVSPHIDPPAVIDALGNKLKFRALCRDLDLPAPMAVSPDELPRKGTYICKPADSFSGRGITVFDGLDRDAIARAAQRAGETSVSGTAVFEEFVEGQLYSYSAFLAETGVAQAFFVREGSSANRFAVDTSYVVRDIPSTVAAALARCADRLRTHLGLRDGLLHIQFILRDGRPFLIEATRRCPGDLYALLIEYSTGYPYAAHYAAAMIGRTVEGGPDEGRLVLRHTVTSSRHRLNTGLAFTRPLATRAFFPLQKLGEALLPDQKARSGILFVDVPHPEAAEATYDAFLARDVYKD